MKSAIRAWRIGRVLLRYRLDDLLDGTPAERWLKLARPFVPRASAEIAAMSRGARLRLVLQELGPIFVKFGQILSTRRDLVPPDIAIELALLQDRVAPFDGETARRIVENALERKIEDAFEAFDIEPLASASIAQVHAARLAPQNGRPAREVVVKVLRPDIEGKIAGDIALLNALAALVERAHPSADKIRPRAIVAEVESTLAAELDLQREGANASVLRRFWADSDDMYVPEVIWSHTSERALTLERVYGIPSDDIAALDAAGIDRRALAAKGVRVFYTQVFRDNFFHADAHAGNIWVDSDPARRRNPRFISLDFGIMGRINRQARLWLAEILYGLTTGNYRRVAEIHFEAQYVPSYHTVEEFATALRAVGEPMRGKPVSELSVGQMLDGLFAITRDFDMAVQPHLLLLQKTMVMVEGLATALDPDINMWDVAAPFVKSWIRDELGPEAVIADRLREDLGTLFRLPALVRRIEEKFPAKGGAPEQAPLPEVDLIWSPGRERKPQSNHWAGYALAAILGGGAAWALTYWTLLAH